MDYEARRDPDAILRQIVEEEAAEGDTRGKLKIFFGYAAGVGKTYAMLEEAHAVLEKGFDVVVGYVEPHTRADTMALVDGLEQISPSTVQHRGISLREFDLDAVLAMREAGVNIVGIGYTIYLGSEYESTMMAEAGELIAQAHANGLLVVLWIYPRGKAVKAEKDPALIAGAAGVALCLGADFVKVNPPKPEDGSSPAEALKVATMASGRTGLVCAGGSTVDAETFLTQLYDQIHTGGAVGNATGRNIHQRSLDEAVRLTKAISAITLADYSVEDALDVFNGDEDFKL